MANTPRNADPLIGTVIHDQYTLVERVGSGSMGVVYRADQIKLHRPAAVKVLHPALVGDAESLQRFEREAKSISKLDHPNIVRVYSSGSFDGNQHYIAMEWLPDVSLASYMKQAGPLPFEQVIDLSIQLSDALNYAHDNLVIHRDLKPENIHVHEKNGCLISKILDFGLAKNLESHSNAHTLAASGGIFGTPYYMAPEQADGTDIIDARCDIYSLGVIMYEMLTGQLPIRANSSVAQVMAILSEKPQPIPPSIAKKIPAKFVQLLFHMLGKTPTDRPHSMREVTHVLHNIKYGPSNGQNKWILPATIIVATIIGVTVGSLGLRITLPSSTTQTAISEHVTPQEPIATSSPQAPLWTAQLGTNISNPDHWSIKVVATNEPSLESARNHLIDEANENLLLAMASRVMLKNFSQAVYLPVISAKSLLFDKLSSAVQANDRTAIKALMEYVSQTKSQIAAMKSARFNVTFKDEDIYWRRLADNADGTARYTVYSMFSVDPRQVDLGYYSESQSFAPFGLMVTHFFPLLKWVHDIPNGAVITEVQPSSPAERAGIHIGDVVVRIEGETIAGLSGFMKQEALAKKRLQSGLAVNLTISRLGEQLPISIRP